MRVGVTLNERDDEDTDDGGDADNGHVDGWVHVS